MVAGAFFFCRLSWQSAAWMPHLTVMGITGQTRCASDTSAENTMRTPFAIAVLTLLAPATFAADDVYRWKDAGGIWHYSDQPRPGAEKVRGNAPPSTAAAAPAPAAPVPAPAAVTSDPLPVSKEVAQEVRQEAATAKAKNCERATAYYKGLVESPRIRRPPDANGVVTFLTAEEIDKARLDARAAKDIACGP
jgi:hypothetical protein